MTKLEVVSPVKTIISGEHAVVYGAPAIVAAVALPDIVTITRGAPGVLNFKFNGKSFKLDSVARSLSKKNTIEGFIAVVISEVNKVFPKLDPLGLKIEITNSILGSGVGHSAAVAAGLSKALLDYRKLDYRQEQLERITSQCENVFHGLASGVDQQAILQGGVLWFRNRQRRIFKNINASQKLLAKFVLIDTGRALTNTGQVVKKVSEKFKRDRNLVHQFEKVTNNVKEALQTADEELLLKMMRENQELLTFIGVSSKKADKLVDKIVKLGGACKITGAGSIRGENVGMMLAYHPSQRSLTDWLRSNKINYYKARLGIKGLL